MEIEKLCKEDFMDTMRGEPTIRVTVKGVVFFNKAAVKHLGLYDKKKDVYAVVNICRDIKCKSDFGIFKDVEGWPLRKAPAGGAIFNNVGLARHVIDATWERCVSHPVGALKPYSVVFRIARLPLDDGKNKDVYALLRKKD
jgi:hypothetical protein